MTITISSEDPRSIRAIEIAAGASQWARCHTRDGQKAYGVPSQCHPGRYYLVTCSSCDCPDFRRRGLSGARVGQAGTHQVCKHVLAVRLWCELVKAQQQPRSTARSRRGHLSVVPASVQANAHSYDDIFDRLEGD